MRKALSIFTVCFATIAFLGFAPLAVADEIEDIPAGDLSMTQTNYIGARLLKGTENVQVGSMEIGPYGDESSERYSYFQGDTHFGGVQNPETGNKVDIVTEWYWFESSIPRNSDFYVGVIKVKSSPNPVDDWYLKEENGWYGNIMWPDDVVQILEVKMDPSGAAGAVRWDWCVPFDTYSWEPEKNIDVASGYSAGFDAEGGFSEGGILKDLTDKSNIQAKGFIKGSHSVSTKYTITLYKWQVLVSSGADNMRWQMRILKGGNNQDSAYHEYFVVIQAEKGTPVHIPEINIAANFKHSMWWWFDGYEALSATIKDVTFTPPPTCYVDDVVPSGICVNKGICTDGAGFCDPFDGVWSCNYPDEFEQVELTCDALDNDCDGTVDEGFPKLGTACDGPDEDNAKNGIFICNAEGIGVDCDEDPCAGKQCGNGCGECNPGSQCVNSLCVADEPVKEEEETGPVYDCNGVTEVGQCDGNWLMYCAGGEVVEQYCAFCCGFDVGSGFFECLTQQACGIEECVPSCAGKECGGDGCGGICGMCDTGEMCMADGTCEGDSQEGTTDYAYTCGNCPEGWVCAANGMCAQGTGTRPEASLADDGGANGCSAAPTSHGSSGMAGMLLLFALFAWAFRFARKEQ